MNGMLLCHVAWVAYVLFNCRNQPDAEVPCWVIEQHPHTRTREDVNVVLKQWVEDDEGVFWLLPDPKREWLELLDRVEEHPVDLGW